MKIIRSYPLQSEAELARIALEGADIPEVVVGVGIGMKGGVLLVPEAHHWFHLAARGVGAQRQDGR
ncbi:MAG: hypothetical protein WAM52_12960 [Steroidobacteraceae bacterium]